MRPPFYAVQANLVRIRVTPDNGPPPVAGPPHIKWRRHSDTKVAEVRRLIEQTTLSYREIQKRTGVEKSNISCWKRDNGWQRPPFAPRPSDMVPTARAGAHLKRRMLGRRLHALAERYIGELEQSACVDPDKLGEALELLKMAMLAASARGKARRLQDAIDGSLPPDERMRPIIELCAAGVDLHRAPREAIEDFLAHRAPPAVKPPRRSRGRKSRLAEEHAWLLEKERD
jgi:hypothetical protein